MSVPGSDPVLAGLVAVEALIRAGDLARAGAALETIRDSAPNDVRASLVEATLARAANESQREIAALRRACALTPRWVVPHLELGKALARADALEEAVAAVDKAVELAPNDLGVLEAAVAVANQAGSNASAERHLRAALALQPGNPLITRALAVCLFGSARYADAEHLYRELLAGGVQDPVDLASLGECLTQLDRREEAIACLERALELQPGDGAIRFNLALARGETPDTQPNEMTQALFDGYSGRFDKHLVGALKYRVPKRVAEIVRTRYPDLRIDVLDLGCGTGLTGVYLGGVKGRLTGVDLSAGMVERARRHGIYTDLVHGDLREELRRSSAGSYDCVIANDVFVYVGDIAEIVADCFRVLRRGGLLIFSCETADDDERGFVLRPSKRYAHSYAYVERLCRAAGFADVSVEHIELRADGAVLLPGFIAVAQRD
ncbi:methyltransferase domain-containing protein [Rudaea sp.]|uniref:methyltransferase domain-containing protein n=1 Tax=Rudaea sp. TaxID=2136325 RepID=UPI00321FCAE6